MTHNHPWILVIVCVAALGLTPTVRAEDNNAKTEAAPPSSNNSADSTASSDKASKSEVQKEQRPDEGQSDQPQKAENEGKSADEKAATKKSSKPQFEYVTEQQPTDWSVEALIGKRVHNTDNDVLGEINNVILNESGEVVAVTLGVGGFLGIGEKDVGVPFSALQFKEGEVQVPRSDPSETRSAETQEESVEEVGRFDAEHSDMKIIIDATEEQLEAAPDFVWRE